MIGEYVEYVNEITRVARKEHKCEECGVPIGKGDEVTKIIK